MPFGRGVFAGKLLCGTVLVVSVAALPLFSSARTDADVAEKLLKKGLAEEAEQLIGKALKKYPSDHRLKLLHARTLPVDKAEKIYREYSSSDSVPPQYRAASYRFLGDCAFINEDYKKAASLYELASWQDRAPVYRHLTALSYYLDKKVKSAMPLWSEIVKDSTDELSAAARLHLAYISMDRGDWKGAYAVLEKSILPDTSSPWYVPYVLAMFECAEKMGGIDKVSIHEGQLLKVKGPLLEDGLISKVAGRIASDTEIKEKTSASRENGKKGAGAKEETTISDVLVKDRRKEKKKTGVSFTVQVGAFGSKENAENLRRKLGATYSGVTVLPTSKGDQTLYRVRVGEFGSRDEAKAFAEEKLEKAGLSTSIVEK
ncbi:MAG: SPOR domain-containing protein [Chitinispirillaceae bacterium]